jgi:hypothetical protein
MMGPVIISWLGRTVGVFFAPETYNRLRRAEAHLEMVELSETLKARGVAAAKIFEASHRIGARP